MLVSARREEDLTEATAAPGGSKACARDLTTAAHFGPMSSRHWCVCVGCRLVVDDCKSEGGCVPDPTTALLQQVWATHPTHWLSYPVTGLTMNLSSAAVGCSHSTPHTLTMLHWPLFLPRASPKSMRFPVYPQSSRESHVHFSIMKLRLGVGTGTESLYVSSSSCSPHRPSAAAAAALVVSSFVIMNTRLSCTKHVLQQL